MEGDSKSDRTVETDDTTWKVSKILEKVGLVNVETSVFYKKNGTHASKYGHRKPLQWETQEEIEKTYQVDNDHYEVPTYFLRPNNELVEQIRMYIISKHPIEDAKHDRERNTETISEESNKNYQEAIKILSEHFHDALEVIEQQFHTTLNFQKTHTAMLDTVLQNQDESKTTDGDIITKLDVIHTNVEKTNETQIVLMNVTIEIKEDVNAIKTNQEAISAKQENIEQKIDERSLGNELREILRENDPGPSIKKEVERSVKKVEKEVKRFFRKL